MKKGLVKLLAFSLMGIMLIVGLQIGKSTMVQGKVTTVSVLWRANPYENKAMREAFKYFEKKYPEIKVNYIVVTWDEYEPKLTTLFAAGTPADIFSCVGAGGIAKYLNMNMALNLDPLIERDKLDLSDFFEQSLYRAGFFWKGHLYALPVGQIPTCMYYNLDLFDKAGVPYLATSWEDKTWTMEKMLEYARKLTKDTDGDGKIDQWGVRWNVWTPHSDAWLWGGDIFTEEDYASGVPREIALDPEKYPQNYEATVKGLQFKADLTWKHHVQPSPELLDALSALGNPFVTGKIAMGSEGAWFFPGFAKLIKRFKWSIGALPRGTDLRDAIYTDPWCIARTSPNPDEAWELVKYLTSEGAPYIIKGSVVQPSRKSLFHVFSDTYPMIPKAIIEEVNKGGYKYGQESPNHTIARWAEVEYIFRGELDPLWLGKKTAKECVDALIPRVNKVLKEKLTVF